MMIGSSVTSAYTTLSAGQTARAGGAGASASNSQNQGSRNNPNELTEAEKKQVQELKQRDQEVRAHEQAHKTVGGPYASAPTYDTTTGPDGREYAVGGEVKIDASPVANNPEATIRKMDIVIRAALAPADPSPQDRQVAQQAQQARIQAQAALSKERQAEAEEARGDTDKTAEKSPIEEALAEAKSNNPTDNQDAHGQTTPFLQPQQNAYSKAIETSQEIISIFTATA